MDNGDDEDEEGEEDDDDGEVEDAGTAPYELSVLDEDNDDDDDDTEIEVWSSLNEDKSGCLRLPLEWGSRWGDDEDDEDDLRGRLISTSSSSPPEHKMHVRAFRSHPNMSQNQEVQNSECALLVRRAQHDDGSASSPLRRRLC
jgi:hypothetical protein